MIKHFEDLWEEAEKVSEKSNIQNVQENLHYQIDNFFAQEACFEDKEASVGKILYLLCCLSFKWNINTFTALMNELQNRKIDIMEDDQQ